MIPKRFAIKRMLIRLLLLLTAASLMVAIAQQPSEGGKPRHFGVQDGSLPDDPREFRRGGRGNE